MLCGFRVRQNFWTDPRIYIDMDEKFSIINTINMIVQ